MRFAAPSLAAKILTCKGQLVDMQVLLQGHPEDLEKAKKEAVGIEYALQFTNS